MKTKYELFEELLGILGLYYTIIRTGPAQVTLKPLESDYYIILEWNNGLITVTAPEDRIQVLYLEDRSSIGIRVLDIENIIIQEARLLHQPVALALYLYYMLLGLLWGAKADASIRDQDPTPSERTYIELYGVSKEDHIDILYTYTVFMTGKIEVEERPTATSKGRYFSFYPIDYVKDPEGIIRKFFEFFDKISSINRAGRG